MELTNLSETAIQSILVIDDDEQFRGYLCELLKGKGFDIFEAANGALGLEAYRAHQPDLVLTDIVMPEKEGLELIKHLRRENPDARIIAMTGGGNYGLCNNYLQLAKVLGALTTLVKPFRAGALIEEINKLSGSAMA